MSENSEKKKALDAALSQIEKQFGKGSVMKLGDYKSMNVEAISTGALNLDIALGIGGIPRGRIVEIYGPESSGKTTLALHAIAEAQKKGGEAAFIDAEHALDPKYAQKLNSTMRSNKAIPAIRGEILAKDGRTLACSVPQYTIQMDPCASSDEVFNTNISELGRCLSLL